MDAQHTSPAPHWWTPPGESDFYAWLALGLVIILIFVVIFLYASFDKFTEHRGKDTPLKTTIQTLLVIALAYEIFPPLSHFSYLLPLALIATALARDIMLWWSPKHMVEAEHEIEAEEASLRKAEAARD